jgi:serine/threonine protein phosphatase 1
MQAAPPSQPAPGRLPPGLRIYAIGDVHGRDDLLSRLHGQIAADWHAAPAARAAIVHLGDFIDRGPDSAAVLERVAGPPPIPGAAAITLRGNHEAMMLEAVGPGATQQDLALWLMNGGLATQRCYPQGVPERHLALIREMRLTWEAGDYLFVHAGIDPRQPLDAQTEASMLWIREPFLSWPGTLPKVVVHGHTPSQLPQIRANRIGIDTGAVAGGPLTCLVLQDAGLRFLSAS